ncbi:DUF1579 domain-containing protein [Sphingomonas sp. BT-65]|uniref:DUF1579 domain-containing protein n=1 Tax=Sphingomonas sp. BT-65 TaxID=2989821 RepID=UPI002235DB77|nr:DUF1579 domain-containing protein [Sphingomonas sp. BT-65]MCW4460605.1 DUF1579 domain-containing protein [Sphingomonas sp. BT-65]
MQSNRRALMKGVALMITAAGTRGALAQEAPVPLPDGAASKHDFDYFLGSWRVEHRRLRKRLAGSNDWEEFAGRTHCQQLFGGLVNLNESVSYRGGRTSYGMGLRALDEPGGRWADWYLAASDLSKIDPPLYGRFADGVGTFYARETFEGRPVLVRGRFSSVNRDEARWEQAFSTDDGASWETNWVMRYLRTAPPS